MKFTLDKQFIFLLGMLFTIPENSFSQAADYAIRPVPFTAVHVHDQFWKPKIKINAEVTIPYILQQCKLNGRIDNFLRAAKTKQGEKMTEFTFDDTDLYKVIEGASYALQEQENPKLDRYLDTLISIIGAAQEEDGYLFTFRTVNAAKPHPWVGSRRWQNEQILSHELYNSGHLFEAAVAHFQATGKRSLLNIALKNADLLVKDFGPGKNEIYPGHQIVEMGLVKLYRATGRKPYLDLAKFFLDVRGPKGDAYNQAHQRVSNQRDAVGHAVRAAYMYTGMADVAAMTGDEKYLAAVDGIWENVVNKKLYITGGIGATGAGEAFGIDYQLPNMSAYAETCAAIGNVYWNNRMFLLHGDSKYIDVLERTLYNGLLSGVSLSGDHFFYPNPLASMFQHQRGAWFSCACCITNMTRFLPSVPGYVYAQNKNDVYVNLFMSSNSELSLEKGRLDLVQTTGYPWRGKIDITVNPAKTMNFSLKLRIPGWAQQQPVPGDLYTFIDKKSGPVIIQVNGRAVAFSTVKGYAVLDRQWKKGDVVTMQLPMETRKVIAHSKVKDDAGRFAFERGPIVYCIEGPDNKDSLVQNIMVDKFAKPSSAYRSNLLNGVEVISVEGMSAKRQLNSDTLIRTGQTVHAIPYYAWANRGPSEMTVWIPYDAAAANPKPAPTIASLSKVSSSLKNVRMYGSIKDQFQPADSKDTNYPYLHWWPKNNSEEYVQYDFDKEYTLSQSKIYWFDDGPWGGCRIPDGYQLFYRKNGAWVPVKSADAPMVTKDQYNVLDFAPVKTDGLKLVIRLPKEQSTGIHEWAVK